MRETARFERQPGRLLVSGELDLSSAPELTRALAAYNGCCVVIDLAGVEFVDSSGIHALLRARREHPHVRIENVSAAVRRVIDLVGLLGVLLDE